LDYQETECCEPTRSTENALDVEDLSIIDRGSTFPLSSPVPAFLSSDVQFRTAKRRVNLLQVRTVSLGSSENGNPASAFLEKVRKSTRFYIIAPGRRRREPIIGGASGPVTWFVLESGGRRSCLGS